MKKTTHHHKISGELISEIALLVQNLTLLRDEWIQSHLVSQNIIQVILYLCNEVRFGSYVCIIALESLQDLLIGSENCQQRQ